MDACVPAPALLTNQMSFQRNMKRHLIRQQRRCRYTGIQSSPLRSVPYTKVCAFLSPPFAKALHRHRFGPSKIKVVAFHFAKSHGTHFFLGRSPVCQYRCGEQNRQEHDHQDYGLVSSGLSLSLVLFFCLLLCRKFLLRRRRLRLCRVIQQRFQRDIK